MKEPEKIYLVRNPGKSIEAFWYSDPSSHVTVGSIVTEYFLNQQNTVEAVHTVLDYKPHSV